jgi:hypothetical protein
MKLAVTIRELKFEIELLETPTAQALLGALPFESRAQTWGDEVYFRTPVSAGLERDAQQTVAPGTVCFWTEGDAIALPFGPTPMSTDERPKLASRCNVVGRLVGDPRRLAAVRPGDPARVEAA